MSILASELLWYRAASVSDDTPASNGGRVDFTAQAISGASNNLFPNVTEAQRASGITQYRKAFIGVRNSANLTLIDPHLSIAAATPGDGHLLLIPGTQDDTQDEISGRPYGYASLAADASLSATEITVTTEADWSALDAAARPFQVGDLIRIDDRPSIDDDGQVGYRTIATVSYTGTELTLGIDALEHAFTAADGVHVASVYAPGNISAGYESLSVSNETGSTLAYTAAGHLTVPNIGSIRQVWTITITDGASGAFRLDGDTLGSGVATGATGALLSPNNPNGGKYLNLSSGGWSGTPVTGDSLTFTTRPAAIPVWYKWVIPAGASAIASTPGTALLKAESA